MEVRWTQVRLFWFFCLFLAQMSYHSTLPSQVSLFSFQGVEAKDLVIVLLLGWTCNLPAQQQGHIQKRGREVTASRHCWKVLSELDQEKLYRLFKKKSFSFMWMTSVAVSRITPCVERRLAFCTIVSRYKTYF